MDELPHHYTVEASAAHEGPVMLDSEGLPRIESAPPRQFGGPANLWSPESMLAASVAGCFILTFRAVARASSLAWLNLTCTAQGRLERSEGALRFTEFTLRPKLAIPVGANREKAMRVLEKAEHGCLVSASLRSTIRLEPEVIETPADPPGSVP